MKHLNILILIGLAGIAFFIFKLMKATKLQTEVLTALAIKNGVLQPIQESSKHKELKSEDDSEQYEEEDDANGKPKKIKLKKFQKQIVSLFEDGIPKTLGQLKKVFKEKYSDIDDDVKFNNTVYNLKPSNTLNAEKIEKTNYWGLGDWFDEEGSLFEEYVEKISGTNSLTVTKA